MHSRFLERNRRLKMGQQLGRLAGSMIVFFFLDGGDGGDFVDSWKLTKGQWLKE